MLSKLYQIHELRCNFDSDEGLPQSWSLLLRFVALARKGNFILAISILQWKSFWIQKHHQLFYVGLFWVLVLTISTSHALIKNVPPFHQQLMIATRKSAFCNYSCEYKGVSLQKSHSKLMTLLFHVIRQQKRI